jgi:vacuolar protein sorting-associated protein 54
VCWSYLVACEATDLFARAGLANHLRSMQHPDFLVLMQELYVSFLNAVEGLQEQGRAIIEILDSVTP